jgi:hypothetical protein
VLEILRQRFASDFRRDDRTPTRVRCAPSRKRLPEAGPRKELVDVITDRKAGRRHRGSRHPRHPCPQSWRRRPNPHPSPLLWANSREPQRQGPRRQQTSGYRR